MPRLRHLAKVAVSCALRPALVLLLGRSATLRDGLRRKERELVSHLFTALKRPFFHRFSPPFLLDKKANKMVKWEIRSRAKKWCVGDL
jgi:hypothetical protein